MDIEYYGGGGPSAGHTVPSPDFGHELRTFLNAIIGYVELLQEDAKGEGYDSLFPDLENIWLAANHMTALVEENSWAIQAKSDSEVDMSPAQAAQWLREQVLRSSGPSVRQVK